MLDEELVRNIDAALERLRKADWKGREIVRDELIELATAAPDHAAVTEHLERAKPTLGLEARWEIDEVLEAIAPVPEPEPEAEPEPEKPDDGRISAADLNLVYDDPRGLMLHKSKKGDRWFATQPDPTSGQPRTFELRPQEVEQVKAQLRGSPYWLIGGGAA